MRSSAPTTRQYNLLQKLSRGINAAHIGYVPQYERAWFKEKGLVEEGLQARTFNALRDRGWIERAVLYTGKIKHLEAEVYTISKKGLQRIARFHVNQQAQIREKTARVCCAYRE